MTKKILFWCLLIYTMPLLATEKIPCQIGVLAYRSKEVTLQQWQPTADYLNQLINEYSFHIIPLNFNEVETAIQTHSVDFILTNSGHYVNLEYTYGITRIATLVRAEQGHLVKKFGGVIFTLAKRNDINTLTDIVGKRFAAVKSDSLGGFMVAWEQFYEQHIDPFSDFSELLFTGMPHDNVVSLVQSEQADAGTVRTDVLEQLAQEGKIHLTDFKILNTHTEQHFPFLLSTHLYPEWPLAKLSNTSDDLAKLVVIALLKMSVTHPAALAGEYGGWSVPLDYQSIHEMMKKLRIGPYKESFFTWKDVLRQYTLPIVLLFIGLLITFIGIVIIVKINRSLQYQIGERERIATVLKQTNKELQKEISQHKQTLTELKETQAQLVHSEKMAALGHLIAGIAHEINTPLGAIRSAVHNISEYLVRPTGLRYLPHFFTTLSSEQQTQFFTLLDKGLQQETILSTKEKRQVRKSLSQELAAHSIEEADVVADNLVSMGIYDQITPFLNLLVLKESQIILEQTYQLTSLHKSARTITHAADRAAKIIFALKNFAHFDQIGEKIKVNITDSIETVLILYNHQLKQGIDIIKNYVELPEIWCYPDELNQVWTNLIHNALQAMNNKGTLTITTKLQEEYLVVSIHDTGVGIPMDIQGKIFEPFFTTKRAGEGSGLGLDIVRKIIAKHHGRITLVSQPSDTTFNIFLPLAFET